MTTRPQVRLDPEVAEVLARAAERAGHSTTVEANVRLRRALGMPLVGAARPTAAGTATARAPGAGCPHPPARRFKGQCLACGTGGLGPAR